MIGNSYHSDENEESQLARDEAMLAALLNSGAFEFCRDVLPLCVAAGAALLFSGYVIAALAREVGISFWLAIPMVWGSTLTGFVSGAWWKGRFQ